ncbi:hypothetical protein LguiA_031177 [Lonicera macranthoides]
MVLTRRKRKLFHLESLSPKVESTDEIISADNFSPAIKSKMSSPIVSESSCNWHLSHEEAFIQFIEEEFDTGQIGLNNISSVKQINEISQNLKERTGRYFDVAQIRAKFAKMKAKTIAFHKLINSTGFGWSSETTL